MVSIAHEMDVEIKGLGWPIKIDSQLTFIIVVILLLFSLGFLLGGGGVLRFLLFRRLSVVGWIFHGFEISAFGVSLVCKLKYKMTI